jgi:hypothetical protein
VVDLTRGNHTGDEKFMKVLVEKSEKKRSLVATNR